MHQGGQPGNHRNFRIRIACQRTERHRSKEGKAEGSSNIGRSVSRRNLTHVAILGTRPFRDLRNKKSIHIATFLRLRTVALPSISNICVKAQVIGRATTRFRFTGTKKESAIAKKLQRYLNFCFCNRQITETKQIRENYPTKTEWRLNADLKGAAIHLGPAHLGRLPASTRIAPTGQNRLKKQKATEENPSVACTFNGAGNRNRTRNPLITNQLRYRCAMPANRLPIMP